MRRFIYSFYVILGGCSFGILAPFVKLAYEQGIPTSVSVRLQFIVGFILLGLINLLFVRYRFSFQTFVKMLLSGIPMALTTTFYYQSLEYLDASVSIVLLFQYTWMGLIADMVIDRQPPTKHKLMAAGLLFIGSLFAVNIYEINVSHLPFMGVIWGLLAAVSFTFFLLVSGKVANHVPPLRKSFVMSLGAVIVILLLFPTGDFLAGDLDVSDVSFWLLALMLGLFGVVLPPFLFSISIPKVGNGLGTILSSSELPTTIVLSAIILTEQVTFLQVCGIIVILVGIVWANVPELRMQRSAHGEVD